MGLYFVSYNLADSTLVVGSKEWIGARADLVFFGSTVRR